MANAVQLIKQDHKKVASLFQKYQKTKGQEAKREIADQAMEQLEIHAKLEEEIFYPAAKKQLEDGQMINEALKEHQGVKDLIEELRAMESGDEEFDQKWSELVENVEHHVEEEEGELLPQTEDSELDLAQLGEEMAERKEELMEENGGRGGSSKPRARAGAPKRKSQRNGGKSARA